MINRFKELRDEFSSFNAKNEIVPKQHDDKPLIKSLELLNKKHHWILPVATIRKKIYDIIDDDDVEEEEETISSFKKLHDVREDERSKEFSNRNAELQLEYKDYLKNIKINSTPFETVHNTNSKGVLIHKNIETPLTAIVDDFDDDNFETKVVIGDKKNFDIVKRRFFTQEYIVAQDIIDPDNIGGDVINATDNDKINIKSFIILPYSTAHFTQISSPSTSMLTKVALNDSFLHYWQVFKQGLKIDVQTISFRTE